MTVGPGGTDLVVTLHGSGASADLVGSKAAWLDRLIAERFPVPPVAVVTTSAYRAAVAEPSIAKLVDDLRITPATSVDDDARALIDAAFLEAELPTDVTEAIVAAATAVRTEEAPLVAVRSSATAEDLHGSSFAGQYQSFLELGSEEEIARAVRLVWASLWHPAPRAYRRFHGVDEHGMAMAAIVMQLVPAVSAGVTFTRDPAGKRDPRGARDATASPDTVRVEVVRGFGEGLVSGRVTPTVHLVPRSGPAQVPTVVRIAADLGLEAERQLGCPLDLEWAFDGREVHLLQARPITTTAADHSDGFDTPIGPRDRFTTAGIAEMLPGVLPPQVWSVNAVLFEEAFRQLFDDLGVLPRISRRRRFLGRFRGRAALSMDLLEEVASNIPGSSPEEVSRQYFGETPAPTPDHPPGPGRRTSRLARLRHDARSARLRHRSLADAQRVIVAVDTLLENDRPEAQPLDDLLVRRARLLDLAGRVACVETAVATCAVASYRRLETKLATHLGDESAPRWAQRLTAQSGAAEGGWSGEALARLDAGAESPPVRGVLDRNLSWSEARRALDGSDEGRAFTRIFEAELRRAGAMAVVAGPSWAEYPDRLWELLPTLIERRRARALDRGPDADVFEELRSRLNLMPGWRRHRVMTGQIVDSRITALRRLVDDATEWLMLRERTKRALLTVGGELRRLHVAIGAALQGAGRLQSPDDVELLSHHELIEAARGRGPSLATLVRRRHALDRSRAQPALPQQFTGPPPDQPPVLPEGDVLRGWGAGPGLYHGPTTVVDDPATSRIRSGDVLVARSTDASWSPLFLSAGAIVTEEGGPLSHAAIVARELGIPAVLNVPGAVERFRAQRQTVTVDGDDGVVVIHGASDG